MCVCQCQIHTLTLINDRAISHLYPYTLRPCHPLRLKASATARCQIVFFLKCLTVKPLVFSFFLPPPNVVISQFPSTSQLHHTTPTNQRGEGQRALSPTHTSVSFPMQRYTLGGKQHHERQRLANVSLIDTGRGNSVLLPS